MGAARDGAAVQQHVRHGDGRVPVGAGEGSERQDERHETGSGREAVGEQCQAGVSAEEPLGHDPGADHGGEKKGRSEPLYGRAPREEDLFRAARGLRLSCGVLGVLEDRVDLPAIAVRVGEPELVLDGIAAVLALLLLGDDAARLQVAAPAADLLGGLEADA
jgi:hypothetical protein